MANPTKCDLPSCSQWFDLENAETATIRTTVDGRRVSLNFCSIEHAEEWVTADVKRKHDLA